jgi:hypothetical protein
VIISPRIGRCGPLLLCLGLACVNQPHRPAVGRPLTCPDNPSHGTAPGVLSPDAIKCSYDDALGSAVVQVSGKILLEQEVGPGIGLADVPVRVIRTDISDARASDARSDAQGNYRILGIFAPGVYAITVHDQDGRLLAHRRLEITPSMVGKITDLAIVIPLDPRLRGGPSPPPQPGLPPE